MSKKYRQKSKNFKMAEKIVYMIHQLWQITKWTNEEIEVQGGLVYDKVYYKFEVFTYLL